MSVEVRVADRAEARDLAGPLLTLLQELSASAASVDATAIEDRLRDERVRVIVATMGDRLVATATLTMLVTLADGLVGRVEDVVVSKDVRGMGLGRKVMDALHAEARRCGVAHLDLTSRPSREAANHLYQNLGYTRRETNVYRLELGSGD